PLMQIAIGALLAWPTFGLHVEFDPELFLVLFIPPLLFADGWKGNTRVNTPDSETTRVMMSIVKKISMRSLFAMFFMMERGI
ncbi:cation:proton antiporter, partial [Salmonella enterica subsp. enterica serovar Virginia]|nr:cation:proton antiporter [Salmonella enterica subsp. enterica serovar Virginia]